MKSFFFYICKNAKFDTSDNMFEYNIIQFTVLIEL